MIYIFLTLAPETLSFRSIFWPLISTPILPCTPILALPLEHMAACLEVRWNGTYDLVLMTVPGTLSPHMETLHLTKTASNTLEFSLYWEENYPLHSCLPVSLIPNSWPFLHLSLSLGPKAVIPSYENSSLSSCIYPFLH